MSEVDAMPVIGAVICQELGLDTDEIEVDSDLRESGLNSLSALMITVRLFEEHGIDLGPGTLKENYSLCKLRKALHRRSLEAPSSKPGAPDTEIIPSPTQSSDNIAAIATHEPSMPVTTRATAPSTAVPTPDLLQPGSLVSKTMAIIATEMNIAEVEFADSVEWGNLGLDSIMALCICGRFREELEMEIESTVFAEYDSVWAFKKYLSEIETSS